MKFLTVLLTYIALTLATPDEHPLLNIFKRADACGGSCEDMVKMGKKCMVGMGLNQECACKELGFNFYKKLVDCSNNCEDIANALGVTINYTPNELRTMVCNRAGINGTNFTTESGGQMLGVSILPLLAIALI